MSNWCGKTLEITMMYAIGEARKFTRAVHKKAGLLINCGVNTRRLLAQTSNFASTLCPRD